MSTEKIPVILSIDVEPNERLTPYGKAEAWTGFEAAVPFFQERRALLAEATGSPARFNWYLRLDPQIEGMCGRADWPLTTYGRELDTFLRAGDALGVHPHGWRWDSERKTWIGDYGDSRWMEHCIDLSFKTFQNHFGFPSRLLRMGDRWMSQAALDHAASHGIHYDMTIEPGYEAVPASCMGEIFTDGLPSSKRVPKEPYQPSRTDYQRADFKASADFWMIPVSTGKITPKPGRLEKFYRNLFKPGSLAAWNVTLNLNMRPKHFSAVTEDLFASLERPYLAIVVRVDAFLPGSQRENAAANVKFLAEHPLSSHFVFTTPDEAMSLMDYTEASVR